jgi:hypothetical protein
MRAISEHRDVQSIIGSHKAISSAASAPRGLFTVLKRNLMERCVRVAPVGIASSHLLICVGGKADRVG